MSDTFASTPSGEHRVPVRVLFLEGAGPTARARVATPDGGAYWVAAAVVAEGLGVPVDERLPGRRAVAVVGADGDLGRFEPPAA